MSDATKGGSAVPGARPETVAEDVTPVVDETPAATGSPLKQAARRLGEAGSKAATKVSELRPAPGGGATAGATATTSDKATAGTSSAQVTRRTRKARLRLARVDPWSVFKTALLFAVAGAIIFFIATWVVWGAINASGVFDSVNKAVQSVVESPGAATAFRLEDYVNTHRVLGLTALIGAIDAVLFTALATLFSFLYNLAASVMGGLEVTLAED